MRPFGAPGWGSLLIVVGACGCTEFESPTDELAPTEASALNGPEWACLAANAAPSVFPVAASGATALIYSVQMVDLSTGEVYPDMRIRACGVADINCENPVTDWVTVDSRGRADLPLFRDFTGFFEITSSETVPYMFYLKEPLVVSTVEYPITVISLASFPPLVDLLGVEAQPDTGVVVFRSFDCLGRPASGVQLSTDADGTFWYFVEGLPSSAASQTSSDGLGGLVNVPSGLAVIDALAPTGGSIGGPQSFVVRAGWFSTVNHRPRTGERFVRQ